MEQEIAFATVLYWTSILGAFVAAGFLVAEIRERQREENKIVITDWPESGLPYAHAKAPEVAITIEYR